MTSPFFYNFISNMVNNRAYTQRSKYLQLEAYAIQKEKEEQKLEGGDAQQ